MAVRSQVSHERDSRKDFGYSDPNPRPDFHPADRNHHIVPDTHVDASVGDHRSLGIRDRENSQAVKNKTEPKLMNINLNIWFPPINLFSKPWQEKFDASGSYRYINPSTATKTKTGEVKMNTQYSHVAKSKSGKPTLKPHTLLKLYWERCGRPPLEFRYGNDPWVEVGGAPTWSPAFEYRFKERLNYPVGPDEDEYFIIGNQDDTTTTETDDYIIAFDKGFDRGYAQALEDIKTALKQKQAEHANLLKQ